MKTQKTFRKLNATKIIDKARIYGMLAGNYALLADINGMEYELIAMDSGDMGLRYYGTLVAIVETTGAEQERLESRLADAWGLVDL